MFWIFRVLGKGRVEGDTFWIFLVMIPTVVLGRTSCPRVAGRPGPTTGTGGVRGRAAGGGGGVEASGRASTAGAVEVARV